MIYTTSDLHGCLDDWKDLLQKIRFSDKDTMFVLGDSVDFGPDPIGLLHDMMARPNVFPILGNHDLRFARNAHKFQWVQQWKHCPPYWMPTCCVILANGLPTAVSAR